MAVALGAAVAPGIADARIPRTKSLSVTAHADDPLLFLSPDVLRDLSRDRPVVLAFLTAGDAGRGTAYWQMREAGVLASTAEMTGLPNSWSPSPLVIGAHTIERQVLVARPSVSVIFFRLPDGNPWGTGYSVTGNQSLEMLWTGSLGTIDAVDGSTSYTKDDLTATLTALVAETRPVYVRTQDYIGTYGDGDHSDHYSTAYFTRAAAVASALSLTAVSYMGYPDRVLPANLGNRILTRKVNAFLAYTPYDYFPQTVAGLQTTFYGLYWDWLCRQYVTVTDTF